VPALARFGLVLLALGLLVDVAFHATGGDGYPAHVAIFIGMLIVTSSIIHQGVRGNATSRRGPKLDAHW
jgi:hypothetical protein